AEPQADRPRRRGQDVPGWDRVLRQIGEPGRALRHGLVQRPLYAARPGRRPQWPLRRGGDRQARQWELLVLQLTELEQSIQESVAAERHGSLSRLRPARREAGAGRRSFAPLG